MRAIMRVRLAISLAIHPRSNELQQIPEDGPIRCVPALGVISTRPPNAAVLSDSPVDVLIFSIAECKDSIG
jgi:hypothetical protein